MNPYSPLWVRIEKALKVLAQHSAAPVFKEADSILAAMAKEQAEYDAWVNAEEARYRNEPPPLLANADKETATEWLARMKKEGRIPNE